MGPTFVPGHRLLPANAGREMTQLWGICREMGDAGAGGRQLTVLQVEELDKRIGRKLILDRVTFNVQAGSCTALMGRNGAGKSTLIKVLAGLSCPSGGRFRLNGRDPQVDPAARSLVGVVLHEPLLYGELTAFENLLFYGRLFGVADLASKAERLLMTLGLELSADQPVRTFSRGMMQRLSLARAMVHEPAVLLLDEVFAGLDLSAIRQVSAVLLQLKEQGTAAVVVSHDVALARTLADQVVYLQNGRVVLAAPAEEAVWQEIPTRLAPGGAE